MQTFLPYPDFAASASILDRQRLGNQRIEAKDALYLCCRRAGDDFREALNLTDKQVEYLWSRYRNHPAVKMWVGYERSLALYGIAICDEWIERGYVDNQRECFVSVMPLLQGTDEAPPWLGNEDFHRSHRSNLLRKLPEHYRRYWPDEGDSLPYVWPTKGGD